MNPEKRTSTSSDTQNKPLTGISNDSFDSDERGANIKGIIKTDVEDNPEMGRLKSKIVSFSSYDNCFVRGSIPSKSVNVNLDDDTIPDKAIIERRLSKLEEEASATNLTGPGKTAEKNADASTTEQIPASKPAIEEKKVVEETGVSKADSQVKSEVKEIQTVEPDESTQVLEVPPKTNEAEETTSTVQGIPHVSSTAFEQKPPLDDDEAKIAELIESMRPDQRIPRQYVIVEYVEHFCMDDDDPEAKTIFDCHHNIPNLSGFSGKSSPAERHNTAPVKKTVVNIVDINNKLPSNAEKHLTKQTDSVENNILPNINIGYEYHGPSTSIAERNKFFPMCHCPLKELNCGKPAPSEASLANSTTVNKNVVNKHALNKNKSNKNLKKGPSKSSNKNAINAHRSNSKGSKAKLNSANRKNEKKK